MTENIDIKNMKVAKRYALGLLKLSNNSFADLDLIKNVFSKNPELKQIFENPVISAADKKEIAFKVFGKLIDPKTIDFLYILLDNNRIKIYDTICYEYEKLSNNEQNISKVQVVSAIKLEETDKTRIIEKLQKKLKAKIKAEFKVEPDILGGLIFKTEDKILDLSIQNKFEKIKQNI